MQNMSVSREYESKFYSSLTTEERRAELKPTAAASSGGKKEEREERKKQCSLPQRMISLCNLELIPALKQGFSKV